MSQDTITSNKTPDDTEENVDISKGRFPKTMAVPLFMASAIIPFIPSTYLCYFYFYFFPFHLYFGNIFTIIWYVIQSVLMGYGLFWTNVGTSLLLTRIFDIIINKKYGKIKIGSYDNVQSDLGTMSWRA